MVVVGSRCVGVGGGRLRLLRLAMRADDGDELVEPIHEHVDAALRAVGAQSARVGRAARERSLLQRLQIRVGNQSRDLQWLPTDETIIEFV